MSAIVQELLRVFDNLSEPEQQEVATAILRRIPAATYADLSDAALSETADELFRQLDEEEARHAGS